MHDATLASPGSDPDALVDAKFIGELLGLHPETVAEWARRKKLPSHKFGRKTVRFRPSEVFAALGMTITK